MKTTKTTLLFTILVLLLTLLLTACSLSPSTGSRATPTPTKNVATHTPTVPTPMPTAPAPTPTNGVGTPVVGPGDQLLISTSKDSGNIWHLSRYDMHTGQSVNIYTTAAGQIKEAQVSADGQWVLFLLDLYPAMQANAGSKVQIIRVNGQGLQTLYTVPKGQTTGGLEWSPNQRLIAFQDNLNVYLLTVATKAAHLVVPAHGNEGFLPRTWLDATRLYLTPYGSTEMPPLELYLLDSRTAHVQQVLSLPTLGGDFDSSIDGSTLFTCQYVFALPTAKGPGTIEARQATGGHASTIYRTPDDAITALRVASRTTLLFVIHNTGVSNVDTSQNGLWTIKTDGTGLRRLTSETSDQRTLFPTYTQYVWSTISRDGAWYAVKVVQTTSPNAPSSLLIGSLKGGTPVSIASSCSASTLEIAGWTQR